MKNNKSNWTGVFLIRKLGNVLVSMICLCMLVLCILLVGPKLMGWQEKIILSDSMEPAYHIGDLVVVKPCKIDEIQIGEVVTFDDINDDSTTHRVVKVGENGRLITKGDANFEEDPYQVDEYHLTGKVIYCIPWIGRISLLLQ